MNLPIVFQFLLQNLSRGKNLVQRGSISSKSYLIFQTQGSFRIAFARERGYLHTSGGFFCSFRKYEAIYIHYYLLLLLETFRCCIFCAF